jgi:hypothetical protein
MVGAPLAAVGYLIEYIAWTIGIGAVVLTLLSSRRRTVTPPAPAAPPPPSHPGTPLVGPTEAPGTSGL